MGRRGIELTACICTPMRNLTRSVVYRLQVVGQRGAWVALTAAQDRMSLRKTD